MCAHRVHSNKRPRMAWPDDELPANGHRAQAHGEADDERHRRPKARKACAALAAAAAAVTGEGAGSIDARFKSDVLRRLRVLEEYLGLAASSTTSATATATAAAAAAAAAAEDEEAAAAGTDTDGDGHEDTTTMMNVDEEDNGESSSDDADEDLPANYASLGALWQAVEVLKASVPVPGPASVPRRIWKKRTVGELWLAFHERMPGLHFMPRKQIFSLPQPLLLASILYCSSVRGPREAAADLAPHYFAVLCNAIAQLSIPDSAVGRPNPATGSGSGGGSGPDAADPDAYEEWAFQTVLGIVLAGLLTEASNRVVGLWISIAYRLILEYCPSEQAAILPTVTSSDGHGGDGAGGAGAGREWRKLFSGVQIIDLEHASLHLSCPVIPLESPLPALNLGYRDQLYRLSRMMHIGLTHFTGRGLPTIWSVFTTPMTTPPLVAGTVNSNSSHRGSSRSAPTTAHVPMFTPIDAAVIRDWARQLDDWLVEFSRSTPIVSSSTTAAAAAAAAADAPQSTAERQRKLVFRQYVLHRLVVLSIYHPARGCDLWSNSITPQEQHELLLSARATLKLHLHDNSIWANWDLVMITWAALIVVQDLQNIQFHLNMLKQMNDHKLPLYQRLIARLEESLQGVHTPEVVHSQRHDVSANMQYGQQPPQAAQEQHHQQHQQLATAHPGFIDRASAAVDYHSWHIFDQASLQQIGYPVDWTILR
ncbi:MAG: hypothetical protein STHCBS139747_004160 [Sporothrix thermara]